MFDDFLHQLVSGSQVTSKSQKCVEKVPRVFAYNNEERIIVKPTWRPSKTWLYGVKDDMKRFGRSTPGRMHSLDKIEKEN